MWQLVNKMDINELKNLITGRQFQNLTEGNMDFGRVIYSLLNFMEEEPRRKYRITIGTDSQSGQRGADFVTVVVIHRIGSGGRYFWQRLQEKRKLTLRDKIYEEATISLALAQGLIEKLHRHYENGSASYELEIHVDIGKGGPTRDMIKEVVGMIKGSGFVVRTKPRAYAASTIADKHV